MEENALPKPSIKQAPICLLHLNIASVLSVSIFIVDAMRKHSWDSLGSKCCQTQKIIRAFSFKKSQIRGDMSSIKIMLGLESR